MPMIRILVFLVLTGCASFNTAQLDDINLPIAAIQKVALASLPLGKRKVSSNFRTFTSKYFIPEGKVRYWSKPAKGAKIRYYAIINVFGDRRPYDVNVEVVRQIRVRSLIGSRAEYSDNGSDKRLAQILAEYIREQLIQSRKDLNIIDDFRVF